MGTYLNPGNDEFAGIVNSIYVDKTGLIEFINQTLFTVNRLTCVSRPRRFGKSFAAKMLCAYYDQSCDSHALFRGLAIEHAPSFEKYLNHFNVIYLDITWFLSRSRSRRPEADLLTDIQSSVIEELREAFPDTVRNDQTYLPDALLDISQESGTRFFIIIDEWDALFREAKNDFALQRNYISFLRGLFKGGNTAKMIAGAYMTGILPIKKYGTESALTDFREYTMTDPDMLTEYVGFTEEEVRLLCKQYHSDFSQMRQWYDGYSFSDLNSVYNPHSVMSALTRGHFRNYWTRSETYESLQQYIGMNLDGLKDAVIEMLGGESIHVKTSRFQNDLTSLKSRDDLLTLLIHLGYLTYDEAQETVRIPNREVAEVFQDAVEGSGWEEIACRSGVYPSSGGRPAGHDHRVKV